MGSAAQKAALEAIRGEGTRFSLRASRVNTAWPTPPFLPRLILDFWPPELEENEWCSLEPPDLWVFVTLSQQPQETPARGRYGQERGSLGITF